MVININNLNVEEPKEINLEIGNKVSTADEENDGNRTRVNDKFFEDFHTHNTSSAASTTIQLNLNNDDGKRPSLDDFIPITIKNVDDLNIKAESNGRKNLTYFVHKLLSRRGAEYELKIANFKKNIPSAEAPKLFSTSQLQQDNLTEMLVNSSTSLPPQVSSLPLEFLKLQDIDIQKFPSNVGNETNDDEGSTELMTTFEEETTMTYGENSMTLTILHDNDIMTKDNNNMTKDNFEKKTEDKYDINTFETNDETKDFEFKVNELNVDTDEMGSETIIKNDTNMGTNFTTFETFDTIIEINNKTIDQPLFEANNHTTKNINQSNQTTFLCQNNKINLYIEQFQNCSQASKYLKDFCINPQNEAVNGTSLPFYQFHGQNENILALNDSSPNINTNDTCCDSKSVLKVLEKINNFMEGSNDEVTSLHAQKTSAGWKFRINGNVFPLKDVEIAHFIRKDRESAKDHMILNCKIYKKCSELRYRMDAMQCLISKCKMHNLWISGLCTRRGEKRENFKGSNKEKNQTNKY